MDAAREMFLSFDGRIRRRDVWVGTFALLVATAIATLILLPLVGGRWTSLIVNAALVWPLIGLATKRFKDWGRDPRPRVAIYLGPAIVLTILQQLAVGYYWRHGIAFPTGFWPNMLSWAALVLGVIGAFECFFMPGEHGRNRFGPDPRIMATD